MVAKGLLNFAAEVATKITNYFEKTYFMISDAVPPKIGIYLLDLNLNL